MGRTEYYANHSPFAVLFHGRRAERPGVFYPGATGWYYSDVSKVMP
jgi:hypothetical protein